MVVFHTSSEIIRHPDVTYSRKYLDFGQGFYVTTLREQAEKYSSRIIIRGFEPILNTYELNIITDVFSHKRFDRYDEEWLDYVAACRDGKPVAQYDIIEGGIANDRVFDTIDLYFAGRMSKDDALNRLMIVEPYWQICLTTQASIDRCLKFINSEKISI